MGPYWVGPYWALVECHLYVTAPKIQKKNLVSIIFRPVVLGPEMAAPILWVPGILVFFLLEKPHAHKIPPFRGGVVAILEKGGVEVPILLLRAWGYFRKINCPKIRCCTIGPSRITLLIPQEFSGVTEVKCITPISFLRIFWCKRWCGFPNGDKTGWCNFSWELRFLNPQNLLV